MGGSQVSQVGRRVAKFLLVGSSGKLGMGGSQVSQVGRRVAKFLLVGSSRDLGPEAGRRGLFFLLVGTRGAHVCWCNGSNLSFLTHHYHLSLLEWLECLAPLLS